jgi:DNA repair protein RecO (recombination protein O)
MLVTTDAIILHSRKQGDTSKIVTLYTRAFGKTSVIAKGARDTKSKFGGSLETFALSTVVFYKKPHRELYLLSKAELQRSRSRLMGSLEQLEAAARVAELIKDAMHDEETNEELFELLNLTLDTLAESTREDEVAGIVFGFYLRFAAINGYGIQEILEEVTEAEGSEAEGSQFVDQLSFNLQTGEVLTSGVSRAGAFSQKPATGFPVSVEMRGALAFLLKHDLKTSGRLRPSRELAASLNELFHRYFVEHTGGSLKHSFRSGRAFQALGERGPKSL